MTTWNKNKESQLIQHVTYYFSELSKRHILLCSMNCLYIIRADFLPTANKEQ